ncbi:MAG: hypothetical protein LBT95_00130 [Treponema sp.]|jgi:hypothetical protein|nr:hypothetical protein [Treponema sp.]
MASEKKPSIYDDRSTIGSSDELDEYGVWVKSEPQDFFAETSGNLDLPAPDLGDFGDFDMDSALAESGENDFFQGDELFEMPPSEGDSFNEEGFSVDGLEFPDFDSDKEGALTGETEEPFDLADLPESEEISLPGEEGGDSPLDFSEISMTALPGDSFQEEAFLPEEEIPEGAENTPDFDFDTLDRDRDTEGEARERAPGQDLSTQLLMKIAEELSSIRLELSSLKKQFQARREDIPEKAAEEAPGHGFFGGENEEEDEKIALTGDELDTIIHTPDLTEKDAEVPEEPEAPVPEERGDFVFEDDTNQDIAAEDITIDLDLDLDQPAIEALSDTNEIPGEEKPGEPPLPDSPEFEISLDSEELLTEEKAVPDTEDSSFDLSLDDLNFEEDAEVPSGIEEAELGLSATETEELETLMENGLDPMTPLLEDPSYLEEDPLDSVASSFSDISSDLSNAVIDEPDLSGEIKENPLKEPVLESITLDDLFADDLKEDIPLHFDDPALDDAEGEELEIPLHEEESQEMPGEEPAELEEEDFSPVIPEAFTFEEEDAPAFLDEDLGEEEDIEEAALFPAEAEIPANETAPVQEAGSVMEAAEENKEPQFSSIPSNLQQELKTVLVYMDQLLESLPEDKIEEFAKSEYFNTYKKLFKELGLV